MTRKIAFGLALGRPADDADRLWRGPGHACGDRRPAGRGAGAGVAAVTGGRPATGALIGGGVGAVGGAVTTPSDRRA